MYKRPKQAFIKKSNGIQTNNKQNRERQKITRLETSRNNSIVTYQKKLF